ncbi:MAG TPA: response regulator transcription factor [Casimicrobiaceae bacterium]|nr:response regulator transcription factor [Casimicrobiaceae bacterium]
MKILVVDDHPLIVSALGQLLPQLGRPVTVVGAANRDETYAMLAAHPDVLLLLLDLALPGSRGLELLGVLRRDFPKLVIAVLSATHDRATVDSALASGARAFIAKTAHVNELVDSVERLLDGRPVRRPELARPPARTLAGIDLAPAVLGLTQRQSDVLCLLVQGKPNKLICRDLNLSEGTVKVHVSAILRALNVHTRAQAIVELARRGVPVQAFARH